MAVCGGSSQVGMLLALVVRLVAEDGARDETSADLVHEDAPAQPYRDAGTVAVEVHASTAECTQGLPCAMWPSSISALSRTWWGSRVRSMAGELMERSTRRSRKCV